MTFIVRPVYVVLVGLLVVHPSCVENIADTIDSIPDVGVEDTSVKGSSLSVQREIKNYMNNRCLEILSFDNNNGAFSGMWDCWGGANQKWIWEGEEIRNVLNNKCLEILSFNNNNGAIVGMWDCWGGANQKWYREGTQIKNRLNGKCLEILSFDNNNGAWAGMWDCWGGANQQWYTNPPL
jgi:hypothetical protein